MRRVPAHHVPRESGGVLRIKAFVDGASRGNPGPAGFGAHLTTDDGRIIDVFGFLGVATNNVAEYRGLLEALETALEEGATDVEVISDSELLVKQLLGSYRVRHQNLVPLFQKAQDLRRKFRTFEIRHTVRSGNKEADRLANLAIDLGEPRRIERRSDVGLDGS